MPFGETAAVRSIRHPRSSAESPVGLFKSTAAPSERQSKIPTLTPRWKQLADRAEILRTLGRLLGQASRSW